MRTTAYKRRAAARSAQPDPHIPGVVCALFLHSTKAGVAWSELAGVELTFMGLNNQNLYNYSADEARARVERLARMVERAAAVHRIDDERGRALAERGQLLGAQTRDLRPDDKPRRIADHEPASRRVVPGPPRTLPAAPTGHESGRAI